MAIVGYGATITIGGSTVVHDLNSADLPFKIAMIDVTSFSAATPGTEQYIPGLLGTQIKFSGFWNKGDTGQQQLETAFFGRTKVALVVSPNGGTNSYGFSAWISDYGVKTDPKSAVSADFSLQLDGGVTIV